MRTMTRRSRRMSRRMRRSEEQQHCQPQKQQQQRQRDAQHDDDSEHPAAASPRRHVDRKSRATAVDAEVEAMKGEAVVVHFGSILSGV